MGIDCATLTRPEASNTAIPSNRAAAAAQATRQTGVLIGLPSTLVSCVGLLPLGRPLEVGPPREVESRHQNAPLADKVIRGRNAEPMRRDPVRAALRGDPIRAALGRAPIRAALGRYPV